MDRSFRDLANPVPVFVIRIQDGIYAKLNDRNKPLQEFGSRYLDSAGKHAQVPLRNRFFRRKFLDNGVGRLFYIQLLWQPAQEQEPLTQSAKFQK